jgi:hypothetical protein
MWQIFVPPCVMSQVRSTLPFVTSGADWPVPVNVKLQWVSVVMPAIVQLVNLKVPDAADQTAPTNGLEPIVPVASLPPQISDNPPPDTVTGPPVAVNVVPPSLTHVTAPADADITPRSDISETTNTHMRMILLISCSDPYEVS